MACNKKLTEDILFGCADAGKAFLADGTAVLINYEDIDWTSTTTSGATVTELTLKSGSTGYKLEWYRNLGNVSSQFNKDTENYDGFGHSFICRLPNSSAANAERATELKGGKYAVVVKTNYKGVDNKDAFKMYGFEGMELSEMTNATNENAGSTLYTLATPEQVVEEYLYRVLLETDYATTQASFDSLFVEA